MAIGQSNRKWFQKTISRRHYYLGEATEYYTRWLEDRNQNLLMRGESNTSLSHKRIRQQPLHRTTTRTRNPIHIYLTTTSPK
jgi:hypothetical protein